MAEQLTQRVGLPPQGCRYPLWAWARYNGIRHPRPDLRASGHCRPGTQATMLELELPAHQVLLSDFQKWHAVLNRSYLADSEDELEDFEEALQSAGVPDTWPYPEPFATRVVRSWERVFDIEGGEVALWGPVEERQVQAAFWELHLERVRRVFSFQAR